jgi:hypothetical protein
MKKKLFALAAALAATVLAFTLGGCGATVSAVLDSPMPWDMPTLYERLDFKTEKYLMKVEEGISVKDKLLAEGSLSFTLEEAGDGKAKLTTSAIIRYNTDEANGIDSGKTDRAESEVIFFKTNLLPVSSKKTVVQESRVGKENNSYSLDVSYSDNAATFKWTERSGEPLSSTVNASGQVFDNEQLFFAVRAFSAVIEKGSQSFMLYTPADAFIYNRGVRSMRITVASEKNKLSLDKYVGEKQYGLEKNEGGYLETECYPTQISLGEDKSGPPINVYYSAKPFAVSPHISTYKVPVQIVEASYGTSLERTVNTFHSLSDYKASF